MTIKHVLSAGVILLLFFSLCSVSAALEAVEGYDENTEVTVKGEVKEVIKGMHGPLILKVASESRAYYIVTAPAWYLKRENISFQQDSVLEVAGSKYFGKDGQIYIIARKIKEEKTGKEIHLRDSFCKPMWHGMRSQ